MTESVRDATKELLLLFFAAACLRFVAQLANYSLFPFAGGEFHAMFAYSSGYPRAALWAYAGYIGSLSVGTGLLIWLGYPVRRWLLTAASMYLACRYWWSVYAWPSQTVQFHLLVTALYAAIPPLVLGSALFARRFGPGHLSSGSRWMVQTLAVVSIALPITVAVATYVGFRVVPTDEAPYSMGELIDAIYFVLGTFFLPLLVGGAVQLIATSMVTRRLREVPYPVVFVATVPLVGLALAWTPGLARIAEIFSDESSVVAAIGAVVACTGLCVSRSLRPPSNQSLNRTLRAG